MYALKGQDFNVAYPPRPRCYYILMWDNSLRSSGEVSQRALGSLLHKRKFDDILPGSTIFGEIFGGSMKLVGREQASRVDVVEYETCGISLDQQCSESAGGSTH